MAVRELSTIDANGNLQTYYFEDSVEIDNGLLQYKVFQTENDARTQNTIFFQFDLHPINPVAFRVEMMNNLGYPEFSAKGIPEAMIKFMKNFHNVRIYSSLTSSENEYRTKDASKVWRRLFRVGEASFCPISFRYFTIDNPVPLDDLEIINDTCSVCGESIPRIDLDWKIEHCMENHNDNRLNNIDRTPMDFANRLFS